MNLHALIKHMIPQKVTFPLCFQNHANMTLKVYPQFVPLAGPQKSV
jgi:hypothetical protein